MILDVIIAFLAIIVPGFFLALALLKRTGMHIIEISIIGFIFGLIFPPTMIWAEGYLIPYIHAFTFSAGLYNIDVLILTIIGIVLCFQQGAITKDTFSFNFKGGMQKTASTVSADYRQRISELRGKISRLSVDMKLIKMHESEEHDLADKHGHEMQLLKSSNAGSEEMESVKRMHQDQERKLYEQHEREEQMLISQEDSKPQKKMPIGWLLLMLLMLLAFTSRIVNLGVAPKFFEFDPYFDMISTQYILTYGYQLTYSHSAWPTLVNGTIQSIQPIVPYLEAYWYQLANTAGTAAQLNNTLLANVSSVYSPIAAALLVFVVFMYLYHEYGEFPALIGAGLAAAMPTLISTFIAGEQLLEPWGIFSLFFFFAAYLLAAKYPEQKRYAILAGIAFVSTFLGSHYYTVVAGILAAYIVVQGIINVIRGNNTKSFYIMNLVVIGVIILFFALYDPYTTAITNSIPNVLGFIPVIIAFPLFALILVAAFEYVPILAKKYDVVKQKLDRKLYLIWFAILALLVLVLIAVTPLGNPVKQYLSLSEHFTTPSIPLFMTVQEYAPTGLTFDFGNGGFGIIGASVAGIPLLIWLALGAFVILELAAIIRKDSKSSVLSLSIVGILAIAGMSEVKYLPHFGVAYIIAIGIIIGEVAIYVSKAWPGNKNAKYTLYGICLLIVLIEATSLISVFSAAATYAGNPPNQACNILSNPNQTNVLGLNLFCNQVPQAWLSATAWMSSNVGPYGPRILSWWDYGDWINWFGNSNAVIRGDNSVATLDYKVASQYVFNPSENYSLPSLSSFMDSVQAGYFLADDQLIPKWSALDFLACINVNATSKAFATAAGTQYNYPFIIGTSQCELSHDPVDVNIPISPAISDYCSFSNSSITAVHSVLTIGESVPQLLNQTYCVSINPNANGVLQVYNNNGTKANILISTNQLFYDGGRQFVQNGPQYVSFIALYTPNGPNDSITDAPTQFYNSNYYQGFMFGKLKGFTLAYPTTGFTGMNYVNSTNSVVILKLNNFTGTLPEVVPKPAWVDNNYSVPG